MKNDASFYVYVHSRLTTGEPFYVGKGKGHRAGNCVHRSQQWKDMISDDGGFHISKVCENVPEELAFLVEMELIDKYRRLGAELVNKSDGGEGAAGIRHTAEYKRNIAKRMVGNSYRLGVPHTEETKARFRKRRASDETKLKLSVIRKGRPGKPLSKERQAKMTAARLALPHPWVGRNHTEEAKRKMSASAKARAPHSAESNEKKRQALLGRPVSAETRAKISAHRTGSRLSDEMKLKRSEKMRERGTDGRKNP